MECGSDVRCIEDTKDYPERIYGRISIAKRNRQRVRTGVSVHRIAPEPL
jgi:hypothetical protein